jgi:hypothetical protein
MSQTQKPLPNPPDEYDRTYMYDLASLVITEESSTVKVDRDNIFTESGSIILKDTATNNYYRLKVTSGTLGVTILTEDSKGRPVTSDNPYA